MPLMKSPRRQTASLLRRWCLAMPACDRVNDGEHADRVERDQAVDLGRGDHASAIAAPPGDDAVGEDQPMAALVSWRGMKLSPAWKDASRGKSAKLVLAASTRMSIVPAWRA